MRHAEIAQIIEPFDRACESAAGSERAYVQFVDDGAGKRARLPACVGPLEGAVIDQPRGTVNAIGLILRARIGNRIGAIDNEAVVGTGAGAFHPAFPPTAARRLHGMVFAADANGERPSARRPDLKYVHSVYFGD